jgi:GntR family transcriptional regulator
VPAERHILECKRLRASADVARPLGLRTGDAVVQVRRVLSFGGRVPTILEDLWLPGNAFKGLTAEQLAGDQGPTYAMFELEFGVRMVRAEEKIRAVAADAQQAALLPCRQTRRCSAWSASPTRTTTCRWNCAAASTAPRRTTTATT